MGGTSSNRAQLLAMMMNKPDYSALEYQKLKENEEADRLARETYAKRSNMTKRGGSLMSYSGSKKKAA